MTDQNSLAEPTTAVQSGARTPAPADDDGARSLVLTVDEVAAILRISRGLAFAGVRDGSIPHIRIGRRILIPRSALDGLLTIS